MFNISKKYTYLHTIINIIRYETSVITKTRKDEIIKITMIELYVYIDAFGQTNGPLLIGAFRA